MDIVLSVENLPKDGQTIIAKKLSYFCGGKGGNQAASISKLGGDTIFMGKVGNDDWGKTLIRGLDECRVDISRIEATNSCSTGSAFINVDNSGTNSIVVYPGANYFVDCDYFDKYIESVPNIEYCLLQYEIPIETIEHIITKCYDRGIKVVINPSPVSKIPRVLYSKIFMLIVNENELEELTGMSLENENMIEKAISSLVDERVNIVVATFGKKGSIYMGEDKIAHNIDAFSVETVDSTAAGDTFTGGLISSLLKGDSFKKSIKFASAASALAVGVEGAQNSIPNRDEVERFLMGRETY